MSDLTRMQQSALKALRDGTLTGNEIGWAMERLGVKVARRQSHNGRQMGLGSMIAPVLTSLKSRGLVECIVRPDGRSGTAYRLTHEGHRAVTEASP